MAAPKKYPDELKARAVRLYVDTQNRDRAVRRVRQPADQPDQRVSADRQPQSARQPGAGTTCHRQPDRDQHRRQSARAPRPLRRQPGNLFGEGLRRAITVRTEEPPDHQLHGHHPAGDRGIGQCALIEGVHTRRDRLASLTLGSRRGHRGPENQPISLAVDCFYHQTSQVRQQLPNKITRTPPTPLPSLTLHRQHADPRDHEDCARALIFTWIASMNTTGYTRSRGRLHQSVISATTLSVIAETVSLDTEAP